MKFPPSKKNRRCIFTAILILILSGLVFIKPIQANTPIDKAITTPTDIQDDDLTSIRINLDDLPEEFIELPENQLSRMETMMGGLLTGLEEATLINLTGYSTPDQANVLISAIIVPLTPKEIILVDQQIINPDSVEALATNIGGSDPITLDFKGYDDLGNTRFGFSTQVSFFNLDYVVVRRNYLLIEVAYLYREDTEPLRNAIKEAKRLDERAIAIVGLGEQSGFRPVDLFVPKLTTYVPTPLDISTDPGVLGTNLFLAALIVIGFSIGVELMTRTLGEREGDWWKKIKPAVFVKELEEKIAARLRVRKNHSRIINVAKFFIVIFFYGLVFSLLDRSWNPFSITGVVLFVNMTVAYGIVGLLDDIVQWVRLRKWQVSADFSVQPASIFLSSFSTLTSRLFQLVPGLMFGTPKALRVNEALLDDAKQLKLHQISTTTILGTGVGLWSITTVTTVLQRFTLPSFLRNVVGGMEGFFLIIFAVAVENTFIQMLGFSGSVGDSFKRKSRWLWLCAVGIVTFLFYHTLINPRGELAEAFRTGNVQISLIAMIVFNVVAFSIWGYFRYLDRLAKLPLGQIEPGSDSHTLITAGMPSKKANLLMEEPSVLSEQIDVNTKEDMHVVNIYYARPGELKTCPVCMQAIKAEARICRFCRVLFEVKLRGYCVQEHAVVEADSEGKCKQCNHDLDDLHIESRLLEDSTGVALKTPAYPINQNQTDMRNCPYCGRSIKAKAVLCRYCQNKLSNLDS
jgi:hypothetical protein